MSVDSIANSAGAADHRRDPPGGAVRPARASNICSTTAQIESNLNPAAQAATSSAKGLYQFIDQTWLATMKQAGPALGLGSYADAIERTADGRYEVADPTTRNAIMQLRSDPAASAMMAGAFTRANAAQLAAAIGRTPSEGELYIAHFLGSDGAAKLIGAADSEPSANAAAHVPAGGRGQPADLLRPAAGPRSVGEVYAKLTGRFMARARASPLHPALRGTVASQDRRRAGRRRHRRRDPGLRAGAACRRRPPRRRPPASSPCSPIRGAAAVTRTVQFAVDARRQCRDGDNRPRRRLRSVHRSARAPRPGRCRGKV